MVNTMMLSFNTSTEMMSTNFMTSIEQHKGHIYSSKNLRTGVELKYMKTRMQIESKKFKMSALL